MATLKVTKDTIDGLIKSRGILFLDFWASWCGPCRALEPVYEQASEKHQDVRFGKVNTQEETEIVSAFQIMSVPTTMIFRDGILIFAQSGTLTTAAIDSLVSQAKSLNMTEVREKIRQHTAAKKSA
jgi:thioredoxin 1